MADDPIRRALGELEAAERAIAVLAEEAIAHITSLGAQVATHLGLLDEPIRQRILAPLDGQPAVAQALRATLDETQTAVRAEMARLEELLAGGVAGAAGTVRHPSTGLLAASAAGGPGGSPPRPLGEMTKAEAEAVGGKDRDHLDTQASWRTIVDVLVAEGEAGETVAGWLGIDDLAAAHEAAAQGDEIILNYGEGHSVERHEGQVTEEMLLARLLWKRDPAGRESPSKHGVRGTATSYASPESFLKPLLALAREKPGTLGGDLRRDARLVGLGVGDVGGVRGARVRHDGVEGDFVDLRDERRKDPPAYADARFDVARIGQPPQGECLMRFRVVDGKTRLITQFFESKEPT